MSTDRKTIKSYNVNAEIYHQHVSNPDESPFHAYYEKPAIRAELPDLTGLDVLSIGCGSGVDTRWLADNAAKKVVGIDISQGLIHIAKQNNPDIEFQKMDMEQLDFSDETFDLAYSSLAIHYVKDWTKALSETRRVLRKDGLYVFSCHHPFDTAVEFEEEDGYDVALLGKKINQETGERTVYGDYLAIADGGVRKISAVLGGVEATIYHRTFGKMIEQIVASGLRIVRVIEPQPTKEMQLTKPETYEQLIKIPSFMIWVLRK